MDTGMASQKQSYRCSNVKCKQSFDSPKIVQIRVCPFCSTEVKENTDTDCAHYFGYLADREKGVAIPDLCITCENSVDCMLSEEKASDDAVKEIRKWYR